MAGSVNFNLAVPESYFKYARPQIWKETSDMISLGSIHERNEG